MSNHEILPGQPDICPLNNCRDCASMPACRDKLDIVPPEKVNKIAQEIHQEQALLVRSQK